MFHPNECPNKQISEKKKEYEAANCYTGELQNLSGVQEKGIILQRRLDGSVLQKKNNEWNALLSNDSRLSFSLINY